MLKKFMVYLEDRDDVYKVAVPAKNKKAALDYVAGNGEVIKIEDVSEKYVIGTEQVEEALRRHGFGKAEIAWITRTLDNAGITA